jgi:hypothetical protein
MIEDCNCEWGEINGIVKMKKELDHWNKCNVVPKRTLSDADLDKIQKEGYIKELKK